MLDYGKPSTCLHWYQFNAIRSFKTSTIVWEKTERMAKSLCVLSCGSWCTSSSASWNRGNHLTRIIWHIVLDMENGIYKSSIACIMKNRGLLVKTYTSVGWFQELTRDKGQLNSRRMGISYWISLNGSISIASIRKPAIKTCRCQSFSRRRMFSKATGWRSKHLLHVEDFLLTSSSSFQ